MEAIEEKKVMAEMDANLEKMKACIRAKGLKKGWPKTNGSRNEDWPGRN
jgi:hypothetical protein